MPSLTKRLGLRAIETPFLWAAALTAAFYTIVLQDAASDSWLRRYTTEHAVEYFITAFFIWGLVEIAFRMANYPREWRALGQLQLPPVDAPWDAAALAAQVEKQSATLRGTRYATRLLTALKALGPTTTTAELREYLSQLAEQDEQLAHANYALVRFIVWLAPVLGFLGTVIHFGTALSGLSPDTIADQLSHIVGEMGTAFNTTTAALAASTTMMFALFLGERSERRLLRAIDARVEQELLARFGHDAPLTLQSTNPSQFLGAAKASLSAQAMQSLEHFMAQANQLAGECANAWRAERLALETRCAEQDAWLHDASSALAQQATRIDATVTLLANLLERHGQLNAVQAGLAENLRQIHHSSQFDQAIHQLTAAVHLLTARQRVEPRTC